MEIRGYSRCNGFRLVQPGPELVGGRRGPARGSVAGARAGIEGSVSSVIWSEARRCPHERLRGTALSRGMEIGLWALRWCKGCVRTFNALTRYAGESRACTTSHERAAAVVRERRWREGETPVKASKAGALRRGGEHGDSAGVTGFWRRRWRPKQHRTHSEVLERIRGNCTWIVGKRTRPGTTIPLVRPAFRKGARGSGARRHGVRGGKADLKRGLSREQVPVLMAADRSGTTVSATCCPGPLDAESALGG